MIDPILQGEEPQRLTIAFPLEAGQSQRIRETTLSAGTSQARPRVAIVNARRQSYPTDLAASRSSKQVDMASSRKSDGGAPARDRGKSLADPAFVALSGATEGEDPGILRDDARLIAFYLPQFHVIPENDQWWGEGFTEWTNVRRAKPNFDGHDQPREPRELGYYDLTDVEVMRAQAELARLYGVHGFCFYHYWFSGRRVLERPVEQFLASDIELPFCLCWANENWTRTWDGDAKSVLLEQLYEAGDAERFIQPLFAAFRDPRYIKVEGKPLLLVYRARQIPDPKAWFATWRKMAVAAALPGLHIAVVDMHDITTPQAVGADALVEFPPHRFGGPQSAPSGPPAITNPSFTGTLVDYTKIIAQSARTAKSGHVTYRGIMPSWDNTARRQDTGTIVVNAQPKLYGAWLRFLRGVVRSERGADDNFIFVNAWNEWGEGCTLEPDRRWGLGYLEETLRSSFREASQEPGVEAARARLFADVAAILAGEPDHASGPLDAGIIAAQLANYKPQSGLTQNISERLRRWPLAHGMARAAYRAAARLKR